MKPCVSMRWLFAATCLLAGCATSHDAVVQRGSTADDKEVTARNLVACKEQAKAAKLSPDSPSYGRSVDECMRKGGVVNKGVTAERR
jgi:hypothetical protein